jgi:hypothetical protein
MRSPTTYSRCASPTDLEQNLIVPAQTNKYEVLSNLNVYNNNLPPHLPQLVVDAILATTGGYKAPSRRQLGGPLLKLALQWVNVRLEVSAHGHPISRFGQDAG